MVAMTWAIAVLLLVILCLRIRARIWNYYRKCKVASELPGWPRHWLYGNALNMKLSHENYYKWIDYIAKTRYKLTRAWYGPLYPVVRIHHPDPLRRILRLPKSELYWFYKPWLGDGLLISNGRKWQRNRQLLTPAFHFKILRPYVTVYNKCEEILIGKWLAAAKANEPVQVFRDVSLLTLDIILQCACRYESDFQNNEDDPYPKAVRNFLDLTENWTGNPLYWVEWIYYLCPEGRKFQRSLKILHGLTQNVINSRKYALSLGRERDKVETKAESKFMDFLDVLLAAVDENGKGLSEDEIRDEVNTFIFEGHDTTASAISFTLYCLAQYPGHQQKVREEVRNVLDGREWLEFDDLKKLTYTKLCIKEAIRMYPPVYTVMRETTEDVEVEGHMVPKGMGVSIYVMSIHHHPDLWENPLEYNPLRFSPNQSQGRDPMAFVPFSAGPRNCIGQNFAMNEMLTTIASVVNRFSFSLVKEHAVVLSPVSVLKTKNDIKLKLQPLM